MLPARADGIPLVVVIDQDVLDVPTAYLVPDVLEPQTELISGRTLMRNLLEVVDDLEGKLDLGCEGLFEQFGELADQTDFEVGDLKG